MRLLEGHKKDVRTVAYLPDGRLVSGGSDRTVRLWDAETWELVYTIKAKTPVYAVAVAPGGDTLAYAGRHPRDSDGVPIWTFRLDEEKLEKAFHFPHQVPEAHLRPFYPNGIPRSVWSLSYSADGRTLAVAGRVMGGGNIPNGGGGYWFRTDEPSDNGPLASEKAYALRFAPVGDSLAVTGSGAVAIYASARETEPVVTYSLQSRWAAGVMFLPNSPLAVVGVNSALYFVNATKQEQPRKVKTGFRTISALAASPEGDTVFVGGKPGGLEVYNVETNSLRIRYDFGVGGVHAAAASPDGLTVALAGDDGLAVFDWEE